MKGLTITSYHEEMSEGIFFTDNDDRIFVSGDFGKMSERFEIEVYAYVLMNNHYHLLLKTNKSNISKGCSGLELRTHAGIM